MLVGPGDARLLHGVAVLEASSTGRAAKDPGQNRRGRRLLVSVESVASPAVLVEHLTASTSVAFRHVHNRLTNSFFFRGHFNIFYKIKLNLKIMLIKL